MSQPQNIEIKDIPEVLMIGLRFKDSYENFGKYIGQVFKKAGRHVAGAPLALYYDEGYQEDKADIEACIPVKKELEVEGMECRVLPGGKAYTIVHQGPYDTLGESYQILTDRINVDKQEVLIPTREIYVKGPGMIFKGNPKKYLTEIQMLIR